MKMKIDKSESMRVSQPSVKSAGFTLIELMVVLAIMAILTLVAYPGYQESIRKSRRSDGIAAALTLQAAQEKFRASCPVYAESIDAATVCDTDMDIYTVQADDESPEKYYALSISGATGNAYVITATAQGAQAADTDCPALILTFSAGNPNGVKTPADCWP